MSTPTTERKPIGIDCRHALYAEANDGSKDDVLFVKEYIHFDDGSMEMNLRQYENRKRPFWITVESKRKNKYKKESELLTNLRKYECRQSELVDKISSVLYGRRADSRTRLQYLNRSPYLYGTDITPTCLLKSQYLAKWPEFQNKTEATIASFDIETDVVKGHEQIICISVTMGKKCILRYTKDFVGHIPDAVEKTHRKIRQYLAERINTEENPNLFEEYEYDVAVVDTPGQAVSACLKFAHKHKPDYMVGWNIAYDIPRMIQALEREGYDAADEFSDPSVPQRYRFLKWTLPKLQKIAASGRVTNLGVEQTWPMLECLASFQFMDAMGGYWQIRAQAPKEPNYKLDGVLERNKVHAKLKDIPGTEGMKELDWHIEMQENHPIEYGVYNLWDNQGIEALNAKTKDYSLKIPLRLGASDLRDFSSNPKRICDKLFMFYMSRKRVFGCTADDMSQEEDKWVISRTGHIVTLPCDLMSDNGIILFADMPRLRSYFRLFVADLDVSSSYPSTQIFANISRATTFRELSRIEGVTDFGMRKIGINYITGGKSNAVDFCRTVYGAPSHYDLLAYFDKVQAERQLH